MEEINTLSHSLTTKKRWCEVRFTNKKSDIPSICKEVINYLENQKGIKIKFIQSDNGKEYINDEMNSFLSEKGIRRRLTVPYNPEQN